MLALEGQAGHRRPAWRNGSAASAGVTSRGSTVALLVKFDNDASGDATVIEVGGPDSTGLLYRLTRALADLDLDVKTAKIHTIGVDVVDTFYVVGRSGGKILDPDHQAEIRRALLFALEAG